MNVIQWGLEYPDVTAGAVRIFVAGCFQPTDNLSISPAPAWSGSSNQSLLIKRLSSGGLVNDGEWLLIDAPPELFQTMTTDLVEVVDLVSCATIPCKFLDRRSSNEPRLNSVKSSGRETLSAPVRAVG